MIASTPTPSEARPGRRAPKAYQVHRPDPETSPAHQRGRRSPPCSPLRLPHDLPVSERVLATLEHELRLTGKYFREKVHAVLLDLVPSHLQSELGAVLKYASKDGTFEKSYAAMIDPALRRRRTLVRNFAYLDGIGAVEIQRHPLPNGDNRPNTFQLRWPRCLRPHVERVERQLGLDGTAHTAPPAPTPAPTAPPPVRRAPAPAPAPPRRPPAAPTPRHRAAEPAPSTTHQAREAAPIPVSALRVLGLEANLVRTAPSAATGPRRPNFAPEPLPAAPHGVRTPPDAFAGAIVELLAAHEVPDLPATPEAFAAELVTFARRERMPLRTLLVGLHEALTKPERNGRPLRDFCRACALVCHRSDVRHVSPVVVAILKRLERGPP